MPPEDFMPQLREVRDKLEAHYHDMCAFDFTVEEGKLYILSARPGRRTPEATLRVAMDLFIEGQITGSELVRRLTPVTIQEALRPVIDPGVKLRVIGTGTGAS